MPRTRSSPVFYVVAIALWASCTYDVGEDIYGPVAPCEGEECVSYAEDIAPLMEAHCTGCHGVNFPSSGLNLTTHANVAQSAIEGDLTRVLRLPESDPLFMPYFRDPLPEEDIQRIERWTEQGAPNN